MSKKCKECGQESRIGDALGGIRASAVNARQGLSFPAGFLFDFPVIVLYTLSRNKPKTLKTGQ